MLIIFLVAHLEVDPVNITYFLIKITFNSLLSAGPLFSWLPVYDPAVPPGQEHPFTPFPPPAEILPIVWDPAEILSLCRAFSELSV